MTNPKNESLNKMSSQNLPVEVQSSPNSAMTLIDKAIALKLDPDSLEKLYNLHEKISDRWEKHQFHNAVDAFQEECPVIPKSKNVSFVTRSGQKVEYAYAPLELVENTIRPVLHRHGLSYTFDSTVREGLIIVTCTLRHVDGHEISASFSAPVDKRDNQSISDAQKHGAALTYAMRQALKQVLGLPIADPDMDGADWDVVDEGQAANIQALIEEIGLDKSPNRMAKFLAHFKIDSIEDLKAGQYREAVLLLQKARARS